MDNFEKQPAAEQSGNWLESDGGEPIPEFAGDQNEYISSSEVSEDVPVSSESDDGKYQNMSNEELDDLEQRILRDRNAIDDGTYAGLQDHLNYSSYNQTLRDIYEEKKRRGIYK